jgi:protein-disulfide isomerase
MRTLISSLLRGRSAVVRAASLALIALTAAALSLPAQYPGQTPDSAALKPPAGARVAIVEFGDLECPACAHANPLLKQAAAKYNIPWLRHDFLIPYHNWSKNAAVDARWFDSKNKALGDEYRDEIFANQRSIETAGELSQFTEKYAQSHGVALPFAIDPQGKLLGAVNADSDLGRRLGITQTPTIWVVTANSSVKVANPDTDLYSTIDQAMANTKMAHN